MTQQLFSGRPNFKLYSQELVYFCDTCSGEINCVRGSDTRWHCDDCEDTDVCHRCYVQTNCRCPNDSSEPGSYKKHRLTAEMGERHFCIDLIDAISPAIGARMWATMHYFQNRPCIGRRVPVDSSGTTVRYEYETYGHVRERASPIGFFLAQLAKRYEQEDAARRRSGGDFKSAVPQSTTGRPIPPRVSIMLENCRAWLLFDVAAAVSGCSTAPIDSAAMPDIIVHLMKLSEPFVVLVNSFEKAKLVRDATRQLYEEAKITLTIVVADCDLEGTGGLQPANNREAAEALSKMNSEKEPLTTLSAVVAQSPPYDSGQYGDNERLPRFFPERRSDDLFTLFSTSGSTGLPKCAAVSNSAFSEASFSIGRLDRRDPLIFVLYRPLSYATDRDLAWRAFGSAGRLAILEPPVERWLFGGELAAARSSSFSAPPRIFNELWDRFLKEQKAIEAKHGKKSGTDDAGAATGSDDPNDWSQWVMTPLDMEMTALWKKYRELVGDRCTAITTGSAPVNPDCFQWMRQCFQLRGNTRVYESMGTTEAGGCLTDGKIAYGAEIMLLKLEGEEQDLLPNGKLRRGELCVRTKSTIDGYFGNEEATQKLFYIDPKDGKKWVRTGDISEFDPTTGLYSIVGRISCSCKLSNGTFCNPEIVETVLQKHLAVADIAVYAEPGWTVPLAVVSLYDNAEQHGIARPTDADAVCSALRSFAVAEDGIPVSLLPAGILLVPRFCREDGTLTISQKVARPGIKKLYAERLKKMHDTIVAHRGGGGDQQQQQQPDINNPESGLGGGGMGDVSPSGMIMMPSVVMSDGKTVRHRFKVLAAPRFVVMHAFREVLRGVADIPKDIRNSSLDDSTAVSLGADSVLIGTLREKICSGTGINIPLREFGMMPIKEVMARVADPDGTGGRVTGGAGAVGGDGAATTAAATAEAKKKRTAEQVRAMLEKDTVISAPAGSIGTGARNTTTENSGTFTSGATGFIGIHLLDALLKQTAKTPTPHFAMVRGANGTAALQKLQRAAASYRLPAVRDAVKQGRIRVVLGDLKCDCSDNQSSQKLPLELVPSGNSQADNLFNSASRPWTESVGTVYLCGANVNHYLNYENLRGANVKANERLMRCFVSSKLEPPTVVYASSASVQGPAFLSTPGTPQAPGRCRTDLPDEALADGGSGYVLSKAAAERLVESMAGCGSGGMYGGGLAHPTKSRIVRIGMCSWSADTGACNTSDWLVTLSCAIDLVGENPFGSFGMTLAPVKWLAGELLKPGGSGSLVGGKIEVQIRDDALKIDMATAVWDKLVAARNGPIAAAKAADAPRISWADFLDRLGARAKAMTQDNATTSENTTRVRQRVELLFANRMPAGERGVGGGGALRDEQAKALGINNFIEFVQMSNA